MARRKNLHKSCRLLSMPPEVRNNIYEEVFGQTGTIYPNVGVLFQIAEKIEDNKEIIELDEAKVLSLTLTCRQIHNEALRFYYGRNTFSFQNTYDLYRYLYMIGWERRQCIKSIEILWLGECKREAAEMIGECSNLRRLYIGVGRLTTAHTRMPQEDLWLARGVAQLLKIRGMPDLDLRVREVCLGGKSWSNLAFEMSIPGSMTMFKVRPNKFAAHHVEEFEKGLKEQMAKGKEEEEEEEEEEEDRCEVAEVAEETPQDRVLRPRKAGPKKTGGEKKPKIQLRTTLKKEKAPRRANR